MKEYIYGKHIVSSALKNSELVLEVFSTRNDIEIQELTKEKKVKLSIMSPKEIREMFPDKNHQGIFALTKPYEYLDLEILIKKSFEHNENPLLIIIDKITDPHNLGAIIRNAAAFNVEGIIIGKHKQVQINDTVHKVSAGSTFNVNVCQVTNINQAIETLKKNKYWIVGTSLDSKQNIGELNKQTPYGFVLGSEGKGISTLTSKLCDLNIKIPMSDKTDSLNVSVASGIVMYELKNVN